MPGKRKRLSNASPMPAYYTNTGGYNLPAVEIRGRAPQWAKDQNYYDQLANFYADRFDVNGNNSRLPEIIGRAKANPEFWNEDGSLNQKGNAYITQQKHFGVGSNYYNRMNEYAKQTAYGLFQVAGAPYLAGLTGRQLLGSTIGGTLGSMEGYEIGKQFDNPATGNYAGSELGSLLGGLAGGAIGFKPKPIYRNYIKGMTKLDQAQTRYWDRKELNQLLKNPQITSENNIGYEVKPTIRTKVGDVEIDNPGLYYHQSAAGKAKNFVSTGRMRTPLEEYWLAKEEAGERIPIKIRSGIEPGYPQSPGSAMFAKGNLWYGLDPNKPDLLVTARDMPISNKNASIMSNKSSLKNLEAQGARRVTNDNIYTQGPHDRQNTAAYIWEPDYGYKRVYAEESPIVEWPATGGRTQFANGGGPHYIKNYVTPGETLESRRRQRKQKERYINKNVYFPITPDNQDIVNNLWNEAATEYKKNGSQKAKNVLYAISVNAKATDFVNLNKQSKQNIKSTQTNNTTNTSIPQYNWGPRRKPFYHPGFNMSGNIWWNNMWWNNLQSEQNVTPTQSIQTTKPTQTSQPVQNKQVNKPTQQKSTVNSKPVNKTAQAPTNISANDTYTVKAGNSPWQIANDNGMTLNTFYKLNPNARNGIYPGDVVNINKHANIHKVKSGDSPWQIAKDNNISLDELYRLNPEARNMIYPGDELILPDKTRNKKRYGGSLRRRLESGGYLSY